MSQPNIVMENGISEKQKITLENLLKLLKVDTHEQIEEVTKKLISSNKENEEAVKLHKGNYETIVKDQDEKTKKLTETHQQEKLKLEETASNLKVELEKQKQVQEKLLQEATEKHAKEFKELQEKTKDLKDPTKLSKEELEKLPVVTEILKTATEKATKEAEDLYTKQATGQVQKATEELKKTHDLAIKKAVQENTTKHQEVLDKNSKELKLAKDQLKLLEGANLKQKTMIETQQEEIQQLKGLPEKAKQQTSKEIEINLVQPKRKEIYFDKLNEDEIEDTQGKQPQMILKNQPYMPPKTFKFSNPGNTKEKQLAGITVPAENLYHPINLDATVNISATSRIFLRDLEKIAGYTNWVNAPLTIELKNSQGQVSIEDFLAGVKDKTITGAESVDVNITKLHRGINRTHEKTFKKVSLLQSLLNRYLQQEDGSITLANLFQLYQKAAQLNDIMYIKSEDGQSLDKKQAPARTRINNGSFFKSVDSNPDYYQPNEAPINYSDALQQGLQKGVTPAPENETGKLLQGLMDNLLADLNPFYKNARSILSQVESTFELSRRFKEQSKQARNHYLNGQIPSEHFEIRSEATDPNCYLGPKLWIALNDDLQRTGGSNFKQILKAATVAIAQYYDAFHKKGNPSIETLFTDACTLSEKELSETIRTGIVATLDPTREQKTLHTLVNQVKKFEQNVVDVQLYEEKQLQKQNTLTFK